MCNDVVVTYVKVFMYMLLTCLPYVFTTAPHSLFDVFVVKFGQLYYSDIEKLLVHIGVVTWLCFHDAPCHKDKQSPGL